jgi:hypothetical protein
MMMFKFHVQVKTEGAVAVGWSDFVRPQKRHNKKSRCPLMLE